MKVAVGIIALVLSMMALLQSCTLFGLSGMANDTAVQQSGAAGIVVAFLIFLGGAFAFGVPGFSALLFFAAFGLSFIAKENFPDMQLWGWVAAVLGMLISFSGGSKKKE